MLTVKVGSLMIWTEYAAMEWESPRWKRKVVGRGRLAPKSTGSFCCVMSRKLRRRGRMLPKQKMMDRLWDSDNSQGSEYL